MASRSRNGCRSHTTRVWRSLSIPLFVLIAIATGNRHIQAQGADPKIYDLTFAPNYVNFSPDGQRIVVVGNGELFIMRVDNGAVVDSLSLFPSQAPQASFYADGNRLLISGTDSLTLWDVAARQILWRARGGVAAISIDGSKIVAAIEDTLLFYKAEDASILRYGQHPFKGARMLKINPKNEDLVCFGQSGGSLYWTISGADGQLRYSFSKSGARTFDLSPDGNHLVVSRRRPIVFDAVTGDSLYELQSVNHGIAYDVAYSPDGNNIATSCLDLDNVFHVRLWNSATGAFVADLGQPRDIPYGIKFSPDGNLLACTSLDRKVYIFPIPKSGSVGQNVATTSTVLQLRTYPNPAHTLLRVLVHTQSSRMATVRLVNASGQDVRVLESAIYEPGEHAVDMNVADLPSGAYFCVVSSVEGDRTIKPVRIVR